MKKFLTTTVFVMALFTFMSCGETSTQAKTDDDKVADDTGVTDSDAGETEDKNDERTDEKNDETVDDVVNDETTDDDGETTDDAPTCKNDEMKCEGTVLTWCKNGEWTTVKDCATESKVCEVIDTTPQCVEKEEKCTPDDLKCSGTKILKCNTDGAWADETECADTSQICEENDDAVTCEDIVVLCTPDKTKCSGDVVLKCSADGNWENDIICSDSDQICVFAADAGSCEFPPCTPAAKKCSGTEIQTCNASEVWEVEVDCDLTSKTCKDDGTTVECIVPPVCTPGETDCNGNTVNLCDAGGYWNPFTNCEGDGKICVKDGTKASCKIAPCIPTEKKCEGKALLTCNGGGTWDSVDCPGIQICEDDGTTVECLDPPECSENEKKCFGNTLMTCSAGEEWGTPLNCEDTDEFCDDTGAVDMCKCTPTENKCNGTELQLCNGDGAWTLQVDCSDTGKVCSDNGLTVECKLASVCDPGKTQCEGNTIETCDPDGQWQLSSTCSGATPACLVVGEAPTCVCADDDLRCQGVALQKCATGVWGQEENCGATSKECRIIEEIPQCAVPLCTPDEKNCVGETLLLCNAEGAWETADVCSDRGELCREKDAEFQCVCTPDTLECGTRTEDNHEDYILYKCSATYDWTVETDCLEADSDNPQACTQTSTTASCTDISCGDGTWHGMVEWCDSSDPVWAAVNNGTEDITCADFWTPESGIGGTGLIKCKSDCRVNLINCEPTETPYGTITSVDGNIAFTLDSTRLSEAEYGPEEAFIFDPIFTGNIDGGNIPLDAITSGYDSTPYSYAVHVDSSNLVALIQLSLEYDPADPNNTLESIDQDIYFLFDDTIQTGTHSVDIYSGLEIDVYGVDPTISGTDKTCLKAFGFLGHVTFSSISNLTNSDGGSFNLSGGPVYLYHPTAMPIYGDISSQLSTPVCPM